MIIKSILEALAVALIILGFLFEDKLVEFENKYIFKNRGEREKENKK